MKNLKGYGTHTRLPSSTNDISQLNENIPQQPSTTTTDNINIYSTKTNNNLENITPFTFQTDISTTTTHTPYSITNRSNIFSEEDKPDNPNILKDLNIYRDPSIINKNKPFNPLLSKNNVTIVGFLSLYSNETNADIFAQDFIDYLDLMYYKIEKTTPIEYGYYSTLTAFMIQMLEMKDSAITSKVQENFLNQPKVRLENEFIKLAS